MWKQLLNTIFSFIVNTTTATGIYIFIPLSVIKLNIKRNTPITADWSGIPRVFTMHISVYFTRSHLPSLIKFMFINKGGDEYAGLLRLRQKRVFEISKDHNQMNPHPKFHHYVFKNKNDIKSYFWRTTFGNILWV